MDKKIVEIISQVLQETGLTPEYLEIEITESMAINLDHMQETLIELKKLGIQIAMDDFGTGYSSLNYLNKFPIDALKIDKSFVQDITIDADDATIVSTIIAMAHHLGLHVIAEGVETDEQLMFLKQQDCDEAQGYFFSEALHPQEFERYILEYFNLPSPRILPSL